MPFYKGQNGSKFHKIEAVRLEGGNPNCIQTTILLGPPAEGRPGPSDDDDDENLKIIGATEYVKAYKARMHWALK